MQLQLFVIPFIQCDLNAVFFPHFSSTFFFFFFNPLLEIKGIRVLHIVQIVKPTKAM